MGILDFIKGELLEVIEWTDDSRDTLSYRYPDDDKAIKNGAQLIVRESQTAQFVYLGDPLAARFHENWMVLRAILAKRKESATHQELLMDWPADQERPSAVTKIASSPRAAGEKNFTTSWS